MLTQKEQEQEAIKMIEEIEEEGQIKIRDQPITTDYLSM